MKKMKKNAWTRFIIAFIAIMMCSSNLLAQNDATIKVRGLVKDDLGPVIGANVVVKGATTTQGTVTNVDGRFELTAPKNSVLIVSFIGYHKQEVAASDKEIVVTLREDSEVLEEVVVIGYGSVKKDDLTGSITTLSADKLKNGMATSATDLLVGKAAGVSVVGEGGAPGSASSIRIRGGSSAKASNEPLIVIDGVPVDTKEIKGMSNPLSTINANDIESFTVLKDASATAIYGSRASNGVIIITTKSGKAGKVKVGYNGSFSINTAPKTLDVMSGDHFREFVTNLYGAGSPQAAALGTASTNWQDEIFHTSFSTDHNLSVAGAVEKVLPYRVSFGYTNENGILRKSYLDRLTGSVNLNPKFFNDMLSVQLNVKGVYLKNRFGDTWAVDAATEYDPTQPVYVDDSEYGNGYHMSLTKEGVPIGIGLANPLAILNQKHDMSDVKRSIGNLQLDYKMHFLPELRANLNLGYDVSKSNGKVLITDNSPMSWVSGNSKNGWGENRKYSQLKRNQLMDFYLNYAKEFDKHKVDLMGGYSWQYFYSNEDNYYPYSAEGAEANNKEVYKTGDSDWTDYQLISFFGRLNYTYNNKYMLTATVRQDGTSRFSKDNRWGTFPSAALAWRINEETFLKNVDYLSNLKLRLGWGITGQQDLASGNYPYLAKYNYSKAGANYFFGDQMVQLLRPTAYDMSLKWEETTTWNLGIDYGFLGNRINGAIDIYSRKTKDLLNEVAIPAGANFGNTLLTNVGELTNKGIELTVNGDVVRSDDWNWNLSYNISYNKNEITKLTINDDPSYKGIIHGGITGGTGTNLLIHQVGKPYGSFYVYEQIYDANGTPIEGAFVDQNKDGKITEEDRIAHKSAAPNVTMGLTSNLSYKSWDLNISMHANLNNYVYNNVQSNREAQGGSFMYDPAGFLKNRISTTEFTNFTSPQYLSSHYVQKASFLRVDNISLGYTFKKPSLRLYATVQNPFLITKYDGIDPEISGGSDGTKAGIDNKIYPRPRIYMIGMSLQF